MKKYLLVFGLVSFGTAQAQTLAPLALEKVPAGAIRPEGWLKEQLNRQITGLSGQLDRIWADVGPNSAWLGGTGEGWERGPYYLRGIVSLAYVTRNETMLAKIKPWIEAILKSQTPNGYFGPKTDEDWWPRWLVCQLLITHHEATGDARVIPFLKNYYAYELAHLREKPLKSWAKARGGEDLTSLFWLYRNTGDPKLLDLARLVTSQTNRWVAIFEQDGPLDRRAELDTTRWLDDSPLHGVNLSHGLKLPALLHQLEGGDRYRKAFFSGLDNLKKHHWQVWGVPVGDEKVRAMGCTRGSETCQTVEFLHTMAYNLQAFGLPTVADQLERAAYNALPAFFDPHFKAHPYYILPNEVAATVHPRPFPNPHNGDVLTYGVISGYPCCTVNMHLGYPLLTEHLWLRTPQADGLSAVVYAPSTLQTKILGREVTIAEETNYPFGEEITFRITISEPTRFPLRLRVPGWCTGTRYSINGHPMGERHFPGKNGGWISLNNEWKTGDVLTLTLPMEIRTHTGEKGSVSVERGPLVYALAVREDWREFNSIHRPKPVTDGFPSWEIRAASPWNYGLVPGATFRVETRPLPAGALPWDPAQCPIVLKTQAHRLPGWNLSSVETAELPTSPVPTDQPAEEVRLLPIGATRLRVAQLPIAQPQP